MLVLSFFKHVMHKVVEKAIIDVIPISKHAGYCMLFGSLSSQTLCMNIALKNYSYYLSFFAPNTDNLGEGYIGKDSEPCIAN